MAAKGSCSSTSGMVPSERGGGEGESPLSSSSSACPSSLGYMIPAEAIRIEKELGIGEFGVVQQGVWTQAGSGRQVQVAIKQLSRERMQNDTREFLKEATIMHSIQCEQIVRLFGIVQAADLLLLVTELAPLRSLLECLRDPLLGQSAFPTQVLCEFAHQICDGMLYLERHRLIHRDLAARNVLVFTQRKVKISDFGLSRALGVGKDYYQTNYNANLKLPIAWCAPECINYLRFTHSSDVWAYGVTLWELFSYGAQPWASLSGAEILEAIDEPNYKRLEKPEGCPAEFYQLMLHFWQHDPAGRPSFVEIKRLLPEVAHTPRNAKSSTDSRHSEFDFSTIHLTDDVFPDQTSASGAATGGNATTSSGKKGSTLRIAHPDKIAAEGCEKGTPSASMKTPNGDLSSITNESHLNMKNEIKEIANRITLHSLKRGHKHAQVKPISAADSLQLDSAIDLAKELASWSMLDAADPPSISDHQCEPLIGQSPKTPNSPNKSKIFNFNFQLKSLTGHGKRHHHHTHTHHHPAGDVASSKATSCSTPTPISGANMAAIEATLSEEAKEAYTTLVERGEWLAGINRCRGRSFSNPSSTSSTTDLISTEPNHTSHNDEGRRNVGNNQHYTAAYSYGNTHLGRPPTHAAPPIPPSSFSSSSYPAPASNNPLPLPPRDRSKPMPQLQRHTRKYPLLCETADN